LGKALIITEKPSVARDIAGALGGFVEHDGYWESDAFLLTFAVGHLLELLPPEEVDPVYKRWTLDTLPIIPEEFRYKPKKGQSERIRIIRRLAERDDVDSLVNACDAGREGELIFREIVQHTGSSKPIERLWLQSMTTGAIRDGFDQLRPGAELEGLAAAAECRAFSDWLIGMNATRALTKRLKSRRETRAWSAGRVQTPTLAILVGRELEVLAHVPRSFWRVTGTFERNGTRYVGTWFDPAFESGDDGEAKEDRIFDEERARAVVAAVTGRAGVAEETRKPSRESAPPLFDLTSLQREGNRRFGWSARRTLNAAQRCYEGHKLLTYPRTDSRCLPENYRPVVAQVLDSLVAGSGSAPVALDDYASAARHLKQAGLMNERRVFDDAGISDHFAIIPTGVLPSAGLSGDDRRLFDLVVRRFLGAFYPPAVWERVERITEVAGHSFRTRARALQEPGWRAVLPAREDEEETALPPLQPGATEARDVEVATAQAEVEADETKPPPRITEARLLSLMENAGQTVEDEDLAAVLHERGLGTPATRADIIENLIAKGYVVRAGKALRPTVKGIRLIDTLERVHIDRLASARLTGELEQHLNDVEHGRRSAADFMGEIESYTREIVGIAKSFEYEDLYAAEPALGPCPRCERPVVERAWFYRCEENPDLPEDQDCPMRFWKDTSGRYLDRTAIATLLRDGKTGTLRGFTARNGNTYDGYIELDRDEWKLKVRSLGRNGEHTSAAPEYEVNPAPLGRCPFDEDCQVVESPTDFVCERKLKDEEVGKDDARPKSCGFVLSRTVCHREITREEAEVYVRNRRTDLLTDFTSRFGRPFSATLVLRENGRHGFEFPPRAGRAGGGAARGSKRAARRKKGTRKQGTRKKGTRKKAARKRAGSKKTARAKSAAPAASRKRATRSKTSATSGPSASKRDS
jgi:DNA topoisomerase-3